MSPDLNDAKSFSGQLSRCILIFASVIERELIGGVLLTTVSKQNCVQTQ